MKKVKTKIVRRTTKTGSELLEDLIIINISQLQRMEQILKTLQDITEKEIVP